MNNKNQNKISFTIVEKHAGLRLDKALIEENIFPTRSFAQNMIEKNFVTVNAAKAKASYTLKINDVVEVIIPEKKSGELIPYNFPLDILFEDDDVIIINKPAGLVVHPSAGHEQDTLVNALLYHTKNLSMKNEERPGIVHRIDKDTSGLLVIAKNDQAHENLAEQFKSKTTHRVYYAIAEGKLKKDSGTITTKLSRHPRDRKRYHSSRDGKLAITHFEVLQNSHPMSLLKVTLETGRTHQIRVHISELGHPLVGDILYGFSSKKSKELGINRFYLHAAELGFVHPKTQKPMRFKVDWPKEDQKKILSWGFKL